jgi:hypothetical protein
MSRTEKWIVPDRIHNTEDDLELDSFIKSLPNGRSAPLANRWLNNTEKAVAFGRRALEVAVWKANLAEQDSTPHHHDWERAHELASKAQKSLGQLLSYFSNDTKLSPEVLKPSLKQFLVQHEQVGVEVADERALQEADTLLAALSLVQKYAQFSGDRRNSLAKRHNPGDPGKLAFVETMFEAWATLTGKLPSKSRTDGPFIRFLRAGWADLFGANRDGGEDFGRAITRVHNLISENKKYIDFNSLPPWA